MLGIKIGLKGSLEFISEEIFEKYSKMKILVFEVFEKGQILRPFLGLAPSKLKIFSKKFNGSICAYRVFYPPIFRRIEGGVKSPPPRSLRYRKKRGPERVNFWSTYMNKFQINVLTYLYIECKN